MTSNRTRASIDEVVARWRAACLIEDGSLLNDDGAIWTADNLSGLYENVVESPLTDGRSFIEKLEEQTRGNDALVLLAAESLVVYYLFAWNGAVGARRKRENVNTVLGWTKRTLPEDSDLWRALGEEGIGHPGQYFLLRPDVQFGFLLDFARRIKAEPIVERQAILDDPWRLRDFVDAGPDEGATGMRHIALHLLHPDYFERIASGEHKQSIARTYAGLLTDADTTDDLDEQLYAIRKSLAELLQRKPNQIDFYDPPLWGTWGSGRDDGTDSVELLQLKKQIVLFGPPGTSKTYEAKRLADQIIRNQALKLWGPVAYFREQDRLEELLQAHVHRLQLHPAYSYEEFIRGLRLQSGNVTYEKGYLLRLVDEIDAESVRDNEAPLPWVLILDEINRADLSRVFGEAFSVLEDRNSEVELAGIEPGKPPSTIHLPDRLYVIGTMNLIDQSLEQIDFALRRRFFWRRLNFDPQRLAEVLPELWRKSVIAERYDWNRLTTDAERFVEHARILNDQISASGLLGRDYQIGHTYFFDIVPLLARAEYMNRRNRASRYLWTANGDPRSALVDLWRMSLEPLLDQYLQGVDAESRQAELVRLGDAFLRSES